MGHRACCHECVSICGGQTGVEDIGQLVQDVPLSEICSQHEQILVGVVGVAQTEVAWRGGGRKRRAIPSEGPAGRGGMGERRCRHQQPEQNCVAPNHHRLAHAFCRDPRKSQCQIFNRVRQRGLPDNGARWKTSASLAPASPRKRSGDTVPRMGWLPLP